MKTTKIVILSLIGLLIGGFSAAQLNQSGFGGTIGIGSIGVPGASNVQSTAASGALVQTVVQSAINRVLSILALIALIILLYAGFLMLTAAGDDEKYNKGFTILKQVALGLVFIGLAWIVVSMIFWLIDRITT